MIVIPDRAVISLVEARPGPDEEYFCFVLWSPRRAGRGWKVDSSRGIENTLLHSCAVVTQRAGSRSLVSLSLSARAIPRTWARRKPGDRAARGARRIDTVYGEKRERRKRGEETKEGQSAGVCMYAREKRDRERETDGQMDAVERREKRRNANVFSYTYA